LALALSPFARTSIFNIQRRHSIKGNPSSQMQYTRQPQSAARAQACFTTAALAFAFGRAFSFLSLSLSLSASPASHFDGSARLSVTWPIIETADAGSSRTRQPSMADSVLHQKTLLKKARACHISTCTHTHKNNCQSSTEQTVTTAVACCPCAVKLLVEQHSIKDLIRLIPVELPLASAEAMFLYLCNPSC
jgi:hypothetical protein